MKSSNYKTEHSTGDLIGSSLVAICLHAMVVIGFMFAPAMAPRELIDLSLPTIDLSEFVLPGPETMPEGDEDLPPLPVQEAAPEETPAQAATAPEEVPVIVPPVIPESATPIPPIEDVTKPEEVVPAQAEVPEEKPEEAPLSDEDILRKAMQDAASTAEQNAPPARRTSEDILAAALAANTRVAGRQGGSSEGSGSYIRGTYLESVMATIQPYLTTWGRSDGKAFELVAILDIAPDGTILKVTIKQPSGNSTFDSNVLRAVREAGKVVPPPTRSLRKLEVPFSSVMGG